MTPLRARRLPRLRRRAAAGVRVGLLALVVAAPRGNTARAQETDTPPAAQEAAPPAAVQAVAPAGQETGEPAAPANRSGLSEAELDDLTARVAAQLRCLVCRNQSVLESPTELAREMQSVIRERLAAGETPEEVKEYFVRTYGEFVLLLPEPKGVNLLVYLLPALGLAVGLIVLIVALRRWSARGAAAAAHPDSLVERLDPLSNPEKAWLEDALRKP